MKTRVSGAVVAAFIVVVLIAAGIVAAVLSRSETGGQPRVAAEPAGEELVQASLLVPYAALDKSQIESVVVNWLEYSWDLNDEETDEFLSSLTQLHIYPEVLEEFDPSGFRGDTGWREDQLVVTLSDGSSFTLAPWGSDEAYDFVVYVDGEPHAAEYEAAHELYRFYNKSVHAKCEENNVPFMVQLNYHDWLDHGDGFSDTFTFTLTPIDADDIERERIVVETIDE